jgi:Tfp pilus assembly protein PilO
MRARLGTLPRRALFLVAAALVLVYALALWLVFVSPKRSEAAEAKDALVAAEQRLADARTAVSGPRGAAAPVADVLRLTKAMPSSADQPGLVLEISRLAAESGVTLRSIVPQDEVAEAGGPTHVPITVIVGGTYAKIAKFLARTRGLVTVRDGVIRARGRLLTVQSISLTESVTERFPKLDATIVLEAYVYDGPIAPEEAPEPPPAEGEAPSAGTDALGALH